MAGTKNLTPFTKGDNRASEAGKKSKRVISMSTILKKYLDNKPIKATKEQLEKTLNRKLTNKNYAELIIESHMFEAVAGNVPAIKEIYDRIDGKVKQEIEVDATINIILNREVRRG